MVTSIIAFQNNRIEVVNMIFKVDLLKKLLKKSYQPIQTNHRLVDIIKMIAYKIAFKKIFLNKWFLNLNNKK